MAVEPISHSRGSNHIRISKHFKKAPSKLKNERTFVPPTHRSFASFASSVKPVLYERQTHQTHVKTNMSEETYKFLQLLIVLVLRAHIERPKHILSGPATTDAVRVTSARYTGQPCQWICTGMTRLGRCSNALCNVGMSRN